MSSLCVARLRYLQEALLQAKEGKVHKVGGATCQL
jgi:hypothetical protein